MKQGGLIFKLSAIIVFFFSTLFFAQSGTAGKDVFNPPVILVNQVGYLPLWPKTALVANLPNNDSVQSVALIDAATQTLVRRIEAGVPLKDGTGRFRVQKIRFDFLKTPGTYFLATENLISFPFRIGPDIYRTPLTKMIRSYFLQRCGVELDDPVTGLYHKACHLEDGILAYGDGVLPKGEKIKAVGGWHDAGDYGKYLATTTVSAARLLDLWEHAPDLLASLSLKNGARPIPMPDFLWEVKTGLSWVLAMQRKDGAFYRKLSGSTWPDQVPPEKDLQPRYVYGISTPETAKAAGVLAMAARIFPPYDPDFARACLASAQRAWAYLELRPKMVVDRHNKDDQGSGPYLYSPLDSEAALKTDADDRFWAAAQLLITTGDQKYKAYVLAGIKDVQATLFEWKDPSCLALISLYRAKILGRDHGAIIGEKIKVRADKGLTNSVTGAYYTANTRFIWGSNKMAAEEGILLFWAHKLTQNPDYFMAAVAQVNFIFGINPFNKSFVTRVGANPVRHIHHIFSNSVQKDIPGLLAGGPNEKAQDNIAPPGLGILSYVDHPGSYATNEYAIDYNASLISLIVLLLKGG